MTDFKDRERGEEAKFAFDEENAFKIAARRNRLVGEWAAGLMGLTDEETDAYKKAVVQADFEAAGFVLAGTSDMLANPDDDVSMSVFDPAIRGKTDRFVMRFVKPD